MNRLAPPALDHVVATCLAKDPDARWQSAGDVASEASMDRSSQARMPPRWRADRPTQRSRRKPRLPPSLCSRAVLVGAAAGMRMRCESNRVTDGRSCVTIVVAPGRHFFGVRRKSRSPSRLMGLTSRIAAPADVRSDLTCRDSTSSRRCRLRALKAPLHRSSHRTAAGSDSRPAGS